MSSLKNSWFFLSTCLLAVLWFQEAKADSVNMVELATGWTLTNQNLTIRKTNLKLPSGVYSALYGEDVLKSYNDVNMRWIAYDNWTYTQEFSVDPNDFKKCGFVNLTFHGIDTIAEIYLNRNFVGRTDNMFVRYSYNVIRFLEENNKLEIKIISPIYAALAKANELEKLGKPVPPYCPPSVYHGECHMNMLRKMQASFAWDWGLAAPSMGIWKSVVLEYYDVALIRDIDIITSKNETHWNLRARVFIDAAGGKDFYAKLTFFAVELLDQAVVTYDFTEKPISHKAPIIEFERAIPVEEVTLWWPNGYGEQKLYPLHFTLNAWTGDKVPNLRKKTVSQKSLHVGFRTIELVEEDTGNGNTFFFRVNGVDIFMKGTNYMSNHILPEFISDEQRIRHLLEAVKDTHMNMIRIWGGGVYESEYFYNLADHYGILVWQDMMFACALYPVTNDFLSSVRTEVIQNAIRLSHHPSVAIFATNNENEIALVSNWYGSAYDRKRFDAEYRELYLGTVMHELKVVEHSSRPKPLVSSPSNGKASEKDNYISADPGSSDYGDAHVYPAFIKDGWNPNTFPRPRFSSEYGFQGLPSMQSWKRSMNADDDLEKLMKHREHSPYGLNLFTNQLMRHLPLPLPEDENYLEALIYMSQISQAIAMKTETELYRSLRDTEHRTMGALYWQLNDVWVAPSWSSIDFYGNYKVLHNWVKDFMAPIAIFALNDDNTKTVNITLACDKLRQNVEGLEVTSNTYLWSELFPINSTTWPATLKPNGVHYDKVIPKQDLFSKGFTKENSFFEYVLSRGDQILSRTFYFPTDIKSAVGMKDPELELTIASKYCKPDSGLVTPNSYSLAITVKYPAVFVYIEITHPEVIKYKLSQNGFMQTIPVKVIHLEFDHDHCVILTKKDIKVLTVNQFMGNK